MRFRLIYKFFHPTRGLLGDETLLRIVNLDNVQQNVFFSVIPESKIRHLKRFPPFTDFLRKTVMKFNQTKCMLFLVVQILKQKFETFKTVSTYTNL